MEFRDSLPKSAVGKILRKILREEAAERKRNPDVVEMIPSPHNVGRGLR